MKKVIFYFVLIAFTFPSIMAQSICDFEDCTTGQPDICLYTYPPGTMNLCSQDQNHTIDGSYSGLIPGDGTTDAIFDLGNMIFGAWSLEFYMYIPSGHEGYYNVQGVTPTSSGEWIVPSIFFNQENTAPGHGYIDTDASSDENPTIDIGFSFPHDTWFRICMHFNLELGMTLATYSMSINNAVVMLEEALVQLDGTPATSIGGVDFYSYSSYTKFYVDDFDYSQEYHFLILNTEDFEVENITFFPNPVKDLLFIRADNTISKVSIYDILGQEVYDKNIIETDYIIDTSNLTNGTYIVQVTIENAVVSRKIVK